MIRGNFFIKPYRIVKDEIIENVITNVGNESLPTSLLLIYFLPVELLVHGAFESSLMENFYHVQLYLFFKKFVMAPNKLVICKDSIARYD